MLLEASPTEEALMLVSASPSSEVFGRMAVDDELLAGTARTIEAIIDRPLAADFADIPDDAQWLGRHDPNC